MLTFWVASLRFYSVRPPSTDSLVPQKARNPPVREPRAVNPEHIRRLCPESSPRRTTSRPRIFRSRLAFPSG